MCEICAADIKGEISWRLYDARGIYVSRVCENCEDKVKSQYRPEIFDDSHYEVDEPIDED